MDLRSDVSQWAIDHPENPVALQFFQEQYLRSHLHVSEKSLHRYTQWWSLVLSTDSYAESPLILGCAVFLNYNIIVWRRENTASINLTLACVFSAPNCPKQIHILLDAEINSEHDQTAHFSLITGFAFNFKGGSYSVGTSTGIPTHDWRLTHTPFDTPTEPAGTERLKYLNIALPSEYHATTSEKSSVPPKATSSSRSLRDRCTTEHCRIVQCAAAIQAKRSLCEDCYDEELTREHNAQLPPPTPISPVVPIPRAVNEDNTYAMAWTNGGVAM